MEAGASSSNILLGQISMGINGLQSYSVSSSPLCHLLNLRVCFSLSFWRLCFGIALSFQSIPRCLNVNSPKVVSIVVCPPMQQLMMMLVVKPSSRYVFTYANTTHAVGPSSHHLCCWSSFLSCLLSIRVLCMPTATTSGRLLLMSLTDNGWAHVDTLE